MVKVDYLWRARKRNCFGLPWTFTVYTLKEDKLCISSGMLNKKYEEIRLYRIRDFTVNCSCKKINAKINVITTLNLSIGTTLEASPVWSAL